MGAVIDSRAFARLREAFELVKGSNSARIVCGGGTDDSVGWFVEPTIVETDDPHFDTMQRELFGPCLTVYPYAESRYAETLELVRQHVALRADRLDLRPGPQGRRAGAREAAARGGQLLRQRQAHGRGRGAAALRRRPRIGHERQGRLVQQPHALVLSAHGQGDVRARRSRSAIRTWSPTARRDRRGRGERRARRARRRLPRTGRRRAAGRAHARRGQAPRRERTAGARRARRGRRRGVRRRELRPRRRGARARRRRGTGGRGCRAACRSAGRGRDRRPPAERARHLVPAAARPARADPGARSARRQRARDGAGSPHHAGTDDGRALLAGQHRRLPGGARGLDATCRATSRCS